MLEFNLVSVEQIPYIYQETTCRNDPQEIGDAMGKAFQAVWEFMQSSGVEGTGKVMAVYHTYDPETMTFRAGFSVKTDAADKIQPPIGFDTTPSGQVVYFQHKGAYEKLRDSYIEMETFLQNEGLKMAAPAWEIYLNDPFVTPEEELLTDVFVALG